MVGENTNDKGDCMNLEKVLSSDFSLFENFGEENKAKAINAVKYLVAISAENQVQPASVDVLACIGTGKGNEIYTDKNRINTKFIEYIKNIERKGPLSIDLIAKINQQCDGVAARIVENQKNSINRSITSIMGEIEEYQANINSKIASIARFKKELEVIHVNKGPNYSRIIEDACADGFFQFVDVKTDTSTNRVTVEMTTKDITWDLPQGGGKIRFGIYKVIFDATTLSFRVLPFKNNIRYQPDRHFQPYVNHTGDVCWGSYNEVVAANVKASKILDNFMILRQILESDTHGNPYVPAWMFNANSEAYNETFETIMRCVFHQPTDLPYMHGYSAGCGHLCRNLSEAKILTSWIRAEQGNYWTEPAFKEQTKGLRFSRETFVWLYRNKVMGKHGAPDPAWTRFAAENPNHEDVIASTPQQPSPF